MLPGVDKKRVAAIQAVSKKITADIKVDYKSQCLQLHLSTEDPEAKALIPNMLKVMSEGLGMQFKMMFAIEATKSEGEIK